MPGVTRPGQARRIAGECGIQWCRTHPAPRPARRFGGGALLLAGILLLAVNLRASIASLPPIVPELHHVLHISTTEEATLASIPVLCFGLFSGIAAPLSRALGEERVLGAAGTSCSTPTATA